MLALLLWSCNGFPAWYTMIARPGQCAHSLSCVFPEKCLCANYAFHLNIKQEHAKVQWRMSSLIQLLWKTTPQSFNCLKMTHRGNPWQAWFFTVPHIYWMSAPLFCSASAQSCFQPCHLRLQKSFCRTSPAASTLKFYSLISPPASELNSRNYGLLCHQPEVWANFNIT